MLRRVIRKGDRIWIHDYHLLLLPKMIRDTHPQVSIGLFVHIPFPSFEVFRLLPWREEVLEGMLGADLVGFQIFVYVRHMLSAVRRLLGVDTTFNRIMIGDRTMKVDVFPRGIDVERFTIGESDSKSYGIPGPGFSDHADQKTISERGRTKVYPDH